MTCLIILMVRVRARVRVRVIEMEVATDDFGSRAPYLATLVVALVAIFEVVLACFGLGLAIWRALFACCGTL